MKAIEIYTNGAYASAVFDALRSDPKIAFKFEGWSGNDVYFTIKASISKIISVFECFEVPYFTRSMTSRTGFHFTRENNYKPQKYS